MMGEVGRKLSRRRRKEEEDDEEGEVLKGDESSEDNSEENRELSVEPSSEAITEASGDEQEGGTEVPPEETSESVPEFIPTEEAVDQAESIGAEESHEQLQENPTQYEEQGSLEEATAEPAQEQPHEEIPTEESPAPVEPESTLATVSETPATTTIGTDLAQSTQDLLSIQSSTENMEHPTPSETPGSPSMVIREELDKEFPVLLSQQEEGSSDESAAAEAEETAAEATITEEKPLEQEQTQEQVEEESGEASLDTSYVDVAAAGLGAAAATELLSDRPSMLEEEIVEAQAETPPPLPTVEGESETIQVETTVIPDAECQELAQSEPTESDPDSESLSERPHPQLYTLDSSDTGSPPGADEDTTGIFDSGVLVPEYVAEETTQPCTQRDDLGESVVLVSHPEQPSSPSTFPNDGSSDTTTSIPHFGTTPIPSFTFTHTSITTPQPAPTGPEAESEAEAEAEHLASDTISLSALNSDSLSGSDSLSDSETSDSEDEAEREWRESLKELELVASMVLVPFLGKWVGRRCAYWGEFLFGPSV
ncbi:hypothetical protein L211DRAFT_446375 [Terfezia boudieri ATCC MYA-4762]|uniref:Uncharacterized protein n=1 Tax=Terfezia boudieri ATCC MYA-4762 TaxID=1051890 RepID=A0A3N4LEE8_9PEZI|nr:hypothetical protein L211DRAFT_446375 [Terfezia boudieri ATCC MYA-4762]